jgi:hypothetical protein
VNQATPSVVIELMPVIAGMPFEESFARLGSRLHVAGQATDLATLSRRPSPVRSR